MYTVGLNSQPPICSSPPIYRRFASFSSFLWCKIKQNTLFFIAPCSCNRTSGEILSETDIVGNPIPKIPSNLAFTNVEPFCLVTSPNTWSFILKLAIWTKRQKNYLFHDLHISLPSFFCPLFIYVNRIDWCEPSNSTCSVCYIESVAVRFVTVGFWWIVPSVLSFKRRNVFSNVWFNTYPTVLNINYP